MQKTTLPLTHLQALLLNSKQSEGKSSQTIDWYAGGIRRYYAMALGKGCKQRPVKIGARAAKAVRLSPLGLAPD